MAMTPVDVTVALSPLTESTHGVETAVETVQLAAWDCCATPNAASPISETARPRTKRAPLVRRTQT
jgi:hypothetical protein